MTSSRGLKSNRPRKLWRGARHTRSPKEAFRGLTHKTGGQLEAPPRGELAVNCRPPRRAEGTPTGGADRIHRREKTPCVRSSRLPRLIALVIGATAFRASSGRLSGRLQGYRRRRQEGRQGPSVYSTTRRQSWSPRLIKDIFEAAYPRREGRSTPDLNSTEVLQPLSSARRSAGQRHLPPERRVELVDGPPDEASRPTELGGDVQNRRRGGALPRVGRTGKDTVYATERSSRSRIVLQQASGASRGTCRRRTPDFTKLPQTPRPKKYQKKVTTYDAEKSGRRLHAGQPGCQGSIRPSGISSRPMGGRAGVNMQSSTGTMMRRVSSGRKT